MAREYSISAAHYEKAAQQAKNANTRVQLNTLADSYRTLARSVSVLEHSTEVLARMDKRAARKKA